MTCILCLFAGCKGLTVGTDTYNYYGIYQNSNLGVNSDISFSSIQIGWYYLNRFFKAILHCKWPQFQFFCYIIIIGGFSIFIKRNSSYILFSLFLFFTLYFYESSLNIMRQYMALAIAFAAITNKQKKILHYIIAVLIAATIHYSALVMLVLLIVDKLNISNKWLIIVCILFSFLVGYYGSGIIGNIDFLMFVININEGAEGYIDSFGTDRLPYRGMAYSLFFILTYLLSENKNSFWLKNYMLFVIGFNLFGSLGQGNRIFIPFQLAMLISIPETYLSVRKYKKLYFLLAIGYSTLVFSYELLSNSGEIIPYKSIL